MDLTTQDIYCRELARANDWERYLVSLFAPTTHRASLWAIYAFNHEVAKIRETVTEPMLGEIRLQWWREAIEGIYTGTLREHQVVLALATAVERGNLPLKQFDALINARSKDLKDIPFETTADYMEYLEQSSAPLHILALRCLAAEQEAAIECATKVGTAYALVGVLRSAPFFFQQNRIPFPRDLMDEYHITERSLFALTPLQELTSMVSVLAAKAETLLNDARKISISRAARPAVLAAAQALWHLARLKKAGYDPYDRRVSASIPFHELRLAMKMCLGKWS